MKNLFKAINWLNLLFNIIVAVIIGAVLDVSYGTAIAVSLFIGTVLSIAKKYDFKTTLFFAVQKEIWTDYIIQKFFKDNNIINKVYRDDEYVMAGKVVHIPQPGASPNVVKNRSSLPAVAVKRNDTDIVYVLEEFTTDPIHIPNADTVELSYNKVDSVLSEHTSALIETTTEELIFKWLSNLTAENILYTTGTAAAAALDGATGNRNSLTRSDLSKAKIKMNKGSVPRDERYCLLSEDMFNELYNSLSETQQRDFSRYVDAENGTLGKLEGFNILTRASVAAATSAGVIKPIGAATAATDCDVALFWQKNSLTAALGDVLFFEDKDSAIYYGDVYSALLRAGGRVRRADNKGVIAIIQKVA
ncbi:MAG: hypothetical protein K2Q03_03480 [Sphingobacteriaceae bacterium]|nr:hypothetical protein [Sphingobacteriaceae bacterium]